jgi:YidC/Oxa1 family membrane protein insertase
MDEKKNFLAALALCAAIWVGYEIFIKPHIETPVPVTGQDSAAQDSQNADAQKMPPGNVQGSGVAPLRAGFISPNQALKEDRLPVNCQKIEGSIRLKGAFIDHWDLKEFHNKEGKGVSLLAPYGTDKAYYVVFRWTCEDPLVVLPGDDTVWTAHQTHLSPESPVTLSWQNQQGIRFQQELILDQNYMLTVKQSVLNLSDHKSGKKIVFGTYSLVCRQGPLSGGETLSYEGPLGVFSGVLKNVYYSDLKTQTQMALPAKSWMGFTDKYWLSALIPGDDAQGTFFSSPGINNSVVYWTKAVQTVEKVSQGQSADRSSRLFLGPKELKLLDQYEKDLGIVHFDLAVDFGYFYFLTKPVFYTLSFFKDLCGSFAGAILLMTVLMKVLFMPLAIRSARSMAKMKKIQPKMEAIKVKYKDDKIAMNQALMGVYKEEKINPISGIWPMFLQIPIFFALYKVLFISIEMHNAPFWGWIHDLSAPDPTTIFNLFGLFSFGVPEMLHIGALPILMGLTMVLQQKVNNTSMTLDPVQKALFAYGLPVIFVYMMARFPAGLIIYWTWNNILGIVQQLVIQKFNLVKENA